MTAERTRSVAIPRLLHSGTDALGAIAPLLAAHDFNLARVLVGTGRGPSRRFADEIVAGLRRDGVDVDLRTDLCGRLDQAAELAGRIIEDGVTVALAVGGGRVLDTVKLAAARTRVDFVSVPTTVSNDGISSPVASLVDRDGRRASHAAQMPSGIVVDIAAIAGAPARTVRAGVGDLLSNLTACLDWRIAGKEGREHFDAYAAMIAESAARPALELSELRTVEDYELLAQGLLLSGLAMAAAGTSRPCSGAEHLISHALDAHLGDRAALHGEQVALGALIAASAHRSPLQDTLRRSFARIGLPTTPEELGLPRRELVAAVMAAPALRDDRWTILSDERYRDAAEAERLVAEACGQSPGGRFRRSPSSTASITRSVA